MCLYFSYMPQNKEKLNEKFYDLLKEIVDTQSAIIERLDKLSEQKNSKQEGVMSASDWARM